MTYIEFFDTDALKNVCTCLTYTPQRVIYIGDNAKVMQRHIADYNRVFSARGHQIEFLFKTVSKSNLEQAVKLLTELVENFDDCVFDITGGGEILNVALGIVCTRFPERDIQIHRVNLRNNMVSDCDKDGVTVFRDIPRLTVEELIRIYGGDVVYGGIDDIKTYRWDMTEEFVEDIHKMWQICREKVRDWNVQIGIFEAMEKAGTRSDDGLVTVVTRAALDFELIKGNAKYKKKKDIVASLIQSGLLTCFDDTDMNAIRVGYKNLQVKRCLAKAGQALEMIVYAVAGELKEEDGQPVYCDALNGVMIDWDGEFYEEAETGNTINEIDVLLMHDALPVFISCKNGDVTAEELFKFHTVAERFGGQYARKILIATAIKGSKNEAHIRQRAQDLQICLVDNLQELDDAGLARRVKNLWNS